MDGILPEEQSGGDLNGAMPMTPTNAPEAIDPSRKALVSEWIAKIKAGKKHLDTAFKRMEQCQQIAVYGADKDWVAAENYVVPVVKRHIDQTVAALYARNPKAVATRKQKVMHTLWDGTSQTAMAALDLAQTTGDPNAMAMLQEINSVREANRQLDKMGRTLEILWTYYINEQAYNYKLQLKSMVRRTKVNGVAYVELDFQRILEKRAEITAQINDVTDQIAHIEMLLAKQADDTVAEDSARVEELRLLLRDLQEQEEIIVREGPVFDFLKSNEVIFDPAVRHLKTWAGGRWIAREYDLTPDEILEIYKVDVSKTFTKYQADNPRWKSGKDERKKDCAKVWRVQDKKNNQFFTVCDGYPDFLVEPSKPVVSIERFFTIFALVFNEVESEDDIIPPSDVWISRHMQNEYNRSRQGLREHRIANSPYYVTERGKLEETDKAKLESRPANAVIELNALLPNQKIQDVLQRGQVVPIDPNQYEVNMIYQDMLRVVGSQEANLGSTAGSTATESSIAENSRMSTLADNVDDLDELLSELAKATSQLMLLELSKETVLEIAGPGAVWPELRPTREEIVKDLTLEIKAGSSGRPNKAAELANLERAMPYVLQMPGLNSMPLLKRYLDLLEIDLDEAIAEGLPSVTAINAQMAKQVQAMMAGADPANGGGAMNAPNPQKNEPQGQPGYNAPGEQGPALP